jgi:hypothetical protein
MSSLRTLWDECRTLRAYVVDTAAVAAWTAFDRLLYEGLRGRICRTWRDVWEIFLLRSDSWCR